MYILVTFIFFILVNEICIYSVCNVYVKKNTQIVLISPQSEKKIATANYLHWDDD